MIKEIFVEHEAIYRNSIESQTWGHLAPIKNKIYRGQIIFAVSCYGSSERIVLLNKFKNAGKELGDSPWLYNCVHNFINDQECENGYVYEFKGTFLNYKFKGTVRKILDPSNLVPLCDKFTDAGGQRRCSFGNGVVEVRLI